MHGGIGSGGPRPANQNARTHGGYSVVLGALTDTERDHFDHADTDVARQFDNEIRLCDIRIARVLTFQRDTLQGAVSKDIEDALSRIQAQKSRLLEGKLRAEAGGDDAAGLDAFLGAFDALRAGRA